MKISIALILAAFLPLMAGCPGAVYEQEVVEEGDGCSGSYC